MDAVGGQRERRDPGEAVGVLPTAAASRGNAIVPSSKCGSSASVVQGQLAGERVAAQFHALVLQPSRACARRAVHAGTPHPW